MKRVFICSPYRAENEKQKNKHIQLAKDMCVRAIEESCAPFAPHLFYPQFLDDDSSLERSLGMLSGMMYLHMCEELWYSDKYGISPGMQKEIEEAREWKIKVVKKKLN